MKTKIKKCPIEDDRKGLVESIKNWNCDNDNCGKGAICNFCALKEKLATASILKKK